MDSYKTVKYAPKFNKKVTELIRTGVLKTDIENLLIDFNKLDFEQQQILVKNELSKKFSLVLLTSFNERTVFQVEGQAKNGSKFIVAKRDFILDN